MKKLFLFIINRGVEPGMSQDLVEEIQLANGIGFSGVPVCIFYTLLFVLLGHSDLGLWFLVGIPLFSVSVYAVNIIGFKASRFLAVSTIPVFWAFITIIFGRECGFYLGFIAISFPPLLFYPTVKKALPMIIWSVLCLIGSIVGLIIIGEPSVVEHAMYIYLLNLGVVLFTTFGVLIFFKDQITINRLKVREQKREIVDSINYASKIQQAVFPQDSLQQKIFPESFCLFLPKDIVSGDFYWFSEKDGKYHAAAIDCTGHGVPGAFMSMIGNSFLHEIIMEQGITSSAKILDHLREKVIVALKQREEGQQKDGMDMALISFDPLTKKIEFAGAKNPMYRIRNGELTEVKGDKMPIGLESDNHKDFTNHEIQTEPGDVIYLFTDGFPDQFGGPKGKKYKYSTFKKLLLEHHQKPMAEQQKILEEEMRTWQGDLEQVDDVCVIGIKI